MSSKNKASAEQEFREAFKRLKANKPERLDRGSPVTQNNVAREAGCDPSALKKDRYPLLVAEIQAFKVLIKEADSKGKRGDNRTKDIKERLIACQKQRDELMSVVDAQRDHIERLTEKIEELESGVIKFKN